MRVSILLVSTLWLVSILLVSTLWLSLMSAESSLSIVASPAQATSAPRPTFSIGTDMLSRPFGLASFEVASSFGLEYAAEARTRRDDGEMADAGGRHRVGRSMAEEVC